jgi:hypothetical protein
MNPLIDVAVIGALLGAEFLLSGRGPWVRPPRLP